MCIKTNKQTNKGSMTRNTGSIDIRKIKQMKDPSVKSIKTTELLIQQQVSPQHRFKVIDAISGNYVLWKLVLQCWCSNKK